MRGTRVSKLTGVAKVESTSTTIAFCPLNLGTRLLVRRYIRSFFLSVQRGPMFMLKYTGTDIHVKIYAGGLRAGRTMRGNRILQGKGRQDRPYRPRRAYQPRASSVILQARNSIQLMKSGKMTRP